MTENNKNPISAFAEEYIIREKQLIPGSFTKLVVEEEKVTNFATENLDNLNNLEVLYSQSNPIELPTSCYEFISNINDTIPYLRYQQVLREQGIIIITLNYDDDDGSILEKIVNLIGIPHTHDNNGKVVWDIKNTETNETEPLARSHQLSEFTFHTDCSFEEKVPNFFGLYVVQHDQMGGGKNLLINVLDLFPHLSKKSLNTLQTCPVKIMVPLEFKKNKEFISECIIDPELNIRYRREIIDFSGLTFQQKEAIDEFEKLVYSPQFSRSLSLNKNQIILLDNKRYLHARTLIKDKNRHLKRIRFFSSTKET